MKIVVNRCFGGFGLSHKAIMRLGELKGITLYPVVDKISKDIYGVKATVTNPNVIVYYHTVPPEEYDAIHKVCEQKRNYAECNALSFSDYDLQRNDPDLVKVVEELGKKANGRFAELDIVEVPDGIEWELEEYDGREWVSEKHRTW